MDVIHWGGKWSHLPFFFKWFPFSCRLVIMRQEWCLIPQWSCLPPTLKAPILEDHFKLKMTSNRGEGEEENLEQNPDRCWWYYKCFCKSNTQIKQTLPLDFCLYIKGKFWYLFNQEYFTQMWLFEVKCFFFCFYHYTTQDCTLNCSCTSPNITHRIYNQMSFF